MDHPAQRRDLKRGRRRGETINFSFSGSPQSEESRVSPAYKRNPAVGFCLLIIWRSESELVLVAYWVCVFLCHSQPLFWFMILYSQTIPSPDNLEALEDFSPLNSKAASVLIVLEMNLKVLYGVFLFLHTVFLIETLDVLTSNKHTERIFLLLFKRSLHSCLFSFCLLFLYCPCSCIAELLGA